MSYLSLHAVGVTRGAPLFAGLDLTLGKGDRLGLVAANGRGKTTLLRCLAGQHETTTGQIVAARGLRTALVGQDLPAEAMSVSLYDHVRAQLPADAQEHESWRVDVVLDDLAVPPALHATPLGQLSGGWQRAAMLAAGWVTEPDVLLLDEPTNHLDLGRIGALQAWLAALPRHTAVIAASHDRAFLDAVTTRTLFLRTEASRQFALPYTKARDALSEADSADARQQANDLNKARQLRQQAAKLKNIGINSGSDLLVTKTRQLIDRAARIEAATKPAHQEKSAGDIRLVNAGTHAKALVTFDDITVRVPGGAALYRTGRRWIEQGDRVVLLGGNGMGKSLLLGLVRAALTGAAPSPVQVAASIRPGCTDQHLTDLDRFDTPFAAVTQSADVGDQRARGILAGAGIAVAQQDSPLARLSGGQKSRLAMLLLRLAEPNFYLLDEPTNHLDIEGQERLESELVAHGATCLLVSHDRSFVRNVGTRFWRIGAGTLHDDDTPEDFFAAAMG